MRIAVYGATGYSGIEALRLLAPRTDVEVAWVGSEAQAGKSVAEVLPVFRDTRFATLAFSPLDLALPEVDYALLAMPHGAARAIAPKLIKQGTKVIDFSGDFRLSNDLYEIWYGKKIAGESVESVYGLPELHRTQIRESNLVANPGCFATCASLALIPAVEAELIHTGHIAVDAKSGISGAGRSPQLNTHFVEADSSFKAYKVGSHQHTPEIEQTLMSARIKRGNGEDLAPVRILLTTQLLPIKRGIYVTAYGNLRNFISSREVYETYAARYEHEPFVKVLPPGEVPEIRQVLGTNQCHIGIYADERTGTLLVMSALDNLIKGAAGQAVQNLNLMAGFNEKQGLESMAWW